MNTTLSKQAADILDYLEQGHTITQLKALRLFGCMRLGARIHDLRNEGHNIITKMVTRKGKTYGQYKLG